MIARRLALAFMMSLAALGSASAQQWPTRPVKIVVTFPPGGASDAAARVISGPLSEKLGQTVLVDNKPGGGTTIGANAVLQARDDHVLMLSNSAPLSIAPFLFDKPPYDPLKDFVHVAYIGSVANAFVVRPAVPAKTMPELIEWIKSQNKVVPFGSGGQGSIGHIIGEMFKAELGLNMEHIGYRGAAPMFQDMMAGQLDFAVVTLTEVLPLAKAGKLRMIAQTGSTRSVAAADVPTMEESGLKGFVVSSGFGLLAPANTPRPVIDRVHGVLVKTLADPTVKNSLSGQGAEPVGNRPEEYEAFNKSEIAKWVKVTRDAGIPPE